MNNCGHPRPEKQSDIEILLALDEAGGHCEAFSQAHHHALAALIDDRLVHRVVYPAGLVIYEITDAGRRVSAAWLNRQESAAAESAGG